MQIEQAESNQNGADFLQRLRAIIDDPKTRESTEAWLVLLSNPELDNLAFRQSTNIPVFEALVKHFRAELVGSDGAYIPQPILRELADRYVWDSADTKLADYFSQADIHRVLSYAYAKHHIVASPDQSEKTFSLAKVVIVMLAVIVLLALLFNGFNKSQETKAGAEQASALKAEQALNWDERLLSCNKVFSAKPSDDFTACLAAAKNGNIDALKRLVWAYSRKGDYTNWQQVADGLSILRRIDRSSQLLAFALMTFQKDYDKLALTGETGIKRLANRNYPAANVLLATMYALGDNTLEQTSNTLWLLERAYQADPDSITPIDLATVYVNGLAAGKDLEKASTTLKKAAADYFPSGTNNVAWYLATLDHNPITEADFALSLAKRVSEHPEHGKRHTFIDTLAASYAAVGNFEQAIETQQRAIDLLEKLETNQANKERERAEFDARLALYKEEKPLVTYSLAVEKQAFFIKLRENIINRLLNRLYVSFTPPPGFVESETGSKDAGTTTASKSGSE